MTDTFPSRRQLILGVVAIASLAVLGSMAVATRAVDECRSAVSNATTISGEARILAISPEMLSMMYFGVPAGANIPVHPDIRNAGKPASANECTIRRVVTDFPWPGMPTTNP